MIKFVSTEARRTLTALIGAVVLTSTFVGAAVAPARAVETGGFVSARA